MPSSKRAKKVSLTKVRKAVPTEKRSSYVDGLRAAVEDRSSVFLVANVEFSRATQFKDVRGALPATSTLFMGKKTLMKIALGETDANELKPGVRQLSSKIEGGHALIVTDASRAAVDAALKGCHAPEYATAGFVATETVTLERGPLDAERFPTSMLAALKKLDLPVEVENSALTMIHEFRVATKGNPLTAPQAKMLHHMGAKVHEFAPRVIFAYTAPAEE